MDVSWLQEPVVQDRCRFGCDLDLTYATRPVEHCAGEECQLIVLACLSSDFKVPETEAMDRQLQRWFQEKVVNMLSRGIILGFLMTERMRLLFTKSSSFQ
jgi:hypothetical protein